MKLGRRLALIAVGAAASAALAGTPALAYAPPGSPGSSAPGQARAQTNCESTIDRQKPNAHAHQTSGEAPTNCDHYFQVVNP